MTCYLALGRISLFAKNKLVKFHNIWGTFYSFLQSKDIQNDIQIDGLLHWMDPLLTLTLNSPLFTYYII